MPEQRGNRDVKFGKLSFLIVLSSPLKKQISLLYAGPFRKSLFWHRFVLFFKQSLLGHQLQPVYYRNPKWYPQQSHINETFIYIYIYI